MTKEELTKVIDDVWKQNLKECKELDVKSPEVILASFIAELRERVPEFKNIDPVVFAKRFISVLGGVK